MNSPSQHGRNAGAHDSNVIAIAGSAGAISVLQTIFAPLPLDFPAPILVVLHQWHGTTGILPKILARITPLPAKHPEDGEIALPGTVYVAPPDYHLIVDPCSAHNANGNV